MIPFDEYLRLFMETEKTGELVIGAWHRGHSRAVYEFRGQVVYCDSTCSYPARSFEALRGLPPLARALFLLGQEPRDTWWTDYCMAGRQRVALKRLRRALHLRPCLPQAFPPRPDFLARRSAEGHRRNRAAQLLDRVAEHDVLRLQVPVHHALKSHRM